MYEPDSYWCKIIASIHGSNLHNWHTVGRKGLSLHNPWASISNVWKQVDSFAFFKLGNGRRTFFWQDSWLNNSPLKICFPRLLRISSSPDGSVFNYEGAFTLSWNTFFRRLLKDEKISNLQLLLGCLSLFQVGFLEDSRSWSLASSVFSVKSLSCHLVSSFPLDNKVYSTLWKSKSPKRVNILMWIMIHGSLNCLEVLQKKNFPNIISHPRLLILFLECGWSSIYFL